MFSCFMVPVYFSLSFYHYATLMQLLEHAQQTSLMLKRLSLSNSHNVHDKLGEIEFEDDGYNILYFFYCMYHF